MRKYCASLGVDRCWTVSSRGPVDEQVRQRSVRGSADPGQSCCETATPTDRAPRNAVPDGGRIVEAFGVDRSPLSSLRSARWLRWPPTRRDARPSLGTGRSIAPSGSGCRDARRHQRPHQLRSTEDARRRAVSPTPELRVRRDLAAGRARRRSRFARLPIA